MFTGIVQELGRITAVTELTEARRLTISGPKVLEGVRHGDSIAVNGVCLTVVDQPQPGEFTADVMQQTLEMTTLAAASEGTTVNLEPAARFGDRIGGHIVQGHIDAQGIVTVITPGEQWCVVRFAITPELAPLIVDKGSIAVHGVSLTVSSVSAATAAEPWFEVSLIPETLSATTLGALAVGDAVNLETDVLARHVARLRAFDQTTVALEPSPQPLTPANHGVNS